MCIYVVSMVAMNHMNTTLQICSFYCQVVDCVTSAEKRKEEKTAAFLMYFIAREILIIKRYIILFHCSSLFTHYILSAKNLYIICKMAIHNPSIIIFVSAGVDLGFLKGVFRSSRTEMRGSGGPRRQEGFN